MKIKKKVSLDVSLQMAITKELLEKGCSNIQVEGTSLWICTDKFVEQFGEIVPRVKEGARQKNRGS